MKRVSEIRLFLGLLLLAVGACTQTEVEEGDIPVHTLKDVDAGFNLNVLASSPPLTRSITFTPDGTIETDTLAVGVRDSVQTKAAASLTEEQENKIAGLWVGQYDVKSGDRLFNQYISSMSGTTVNLKLKQSQKDSESCVYFVSNAGDLGAIDNETILKKHILAYASTIEGLPDGNLCKMVGTWKGVVKEEGVKDITVDMIRMVAKITFTYTIGGTDFSFKPSSVVLKNAPQSLQVEAAAAQLADMTYKTYTGIANDTRATAYWYLPENMAGTVQGAEAVDAEKKKIGTGVENATCIELTGEAVQGGVTYGDVTFCFYPGSDKNNYDIVRNSHYTMEVTLIGIDVSDERITVGKIPSIVVDGANMPAKKGGKKEVQITAQPGQKWVIDMPPWLSALLNDKVINSGVTISHQGPAKIEFRSVEANPKAEERKVSFEIDINGTKQTIEITQDGSTLTKGDNVSLTAETGSEGESSFTATAGVRWQAVLSGDGWLGWSDTNSGTSGAEAPEGAQALKVKSISTNPSAQERTGKITVKVGTSVGDGSYTNLVENITVAQSGSTVGSSTQTVAAEASANLMSSFTATPGLNWTASVVEGSWITLSTTSGGATTGSERLTYQVAVNPSSSSRNSDITVRAGDALVGPTGKITVTQEGAQLSVSEATKTIAATASTGNRSSFTATSGLSWNVTLAPTDSWLSLTSAVSGDDNTTGKAQDITYDAVVNPNSTSRDGTITVQAGNMSQSVTVRQSASAFSAAGATTNIAAAANSTATGSVSATEGLAWTIAPATDNGITISPTSGSGDVTLTFKGARNTGGDRTGTFTVSVTDANPARTITVTATQLEGETGAYVGNLQVMKSEGGFMNWSDATSHCSNLTTEGETDWRLPSMDELLTIYDNKAALQSVRNFTAFVEDWYFTSTFYDPGSRFVVSFQGGRSNYNYESTNTYFRCVRDVVPTQ